MQQANSSLAETPGQSGPLSSAITQFGSITSTLISPEKLFENRL